MAPAAPPPADLPVPQSAVRNARIVRALMGPVDVDIPSPYVVARLAEHVALAGMWTDLAARPYLLDALDPDAVAAAALRTAYGRITLPNHIAAALSARHLLTRLTPPDRLMTRWIAAACGQPQEPDRPRAWAHIGNREPAHVVLSGHLGAVLAVAVVRTGDGAAVASAGTDGTVRIWDPATGRPARNALDTSGTIVTALSGLTVGGGRLLAGVSRGGAVRLWHWQRGAEVAMVEADRRTGDGLLATLPQPGGRELLCTGAVRGVLRLWEVSGERLTPAGDITLSAAVRSIAALPRLGGTALVTGGYDGAVRLWDVGSGTEVSTVYRGTGSIERVIAMPTRDDRPLLVVLADDGRLDVLAVATDGTAVPIQPAVRVPRPGSSHAALTPDGGLLAVGDDSGLVRLWQRGPGGQPAPAMAGHTGAVRAITALALPDGRRLLVTGGDDGTVRLWHPAPLATQVEEGDGDTVTACIAARLGGREVLATGSDRGTVRIWEADTGRPVYTPRFAHISAVHALALLDVASGATVLATGGTERVVRIWDLASGAVVSDPLVRHQGTIASLVGLRGRLGRQYVASASMDSTIRLWDPRTGRTVGDPLSEHRGAVRHLAAATVRGGPDILVSGGDEPALRLWRSTGEHRYAATAVALRSGVRALAVLDSIVAVGLQDRTVDLRAAADGRPISTVDADGEVTALAFVPGLDPALLAVGTADGTVRLRAVPSGRLVRTVLLPLGQRPVSLTIAGRRLVVRTDRGFLGCEIDPRLFEHSPLGGGETPLRQIER